MFRIIALNTVKEGAFRPLLQPLRGFSFTSIALAAKIYKFEDVKKLVQNPTATRKLIDVREENEFNEFSIPTSINIPIKKTPGALGLSTTEFEDLFKFAKPNQQNDELIFFCSNGKRAEAAEELARSYGYKNTAVYPGSVTEWVYKNGKST
ncbi:hypothetical protein KAFR_0B03340 [Kazachstania africana CBS 2517]|uniref:Rhodanese domain-containing protein n=1 Tax=Kazachstania africana (strain ATCC 22294 / BCRC 22015 / CBS 2517 / CECT 1963 / NBRC 1671 / NRRL Y-8276) TaxID=1071382 RepID=H2AQI1_KAZAF|nr:hypothetical protein KAFR_0B03340 [Kazachstania africana CBS 2517]CCF56631.1 hypothetical protein KAFR_0B03340 [Kazachstania africana CBS 2517]